MTPEVEVSVTTSPGAKLPTYATDGSAGMDVYSNEREPVIIQPGLRALIGTGVHVAVPEGFELQVRPRSGMALDDGITVLNAPGTIDSDYRGMVRVILINHGKKECTVSPGDRIAQLVLAPVYRIKWLEAEKLPETTRGCGGLGSTGRGPMGNHKIIAKSNDELRELLGNPPELLPHLLPRRIQNEPHTAKTKPSLADIPGGEFKLPIDEGSYLLARFDSHIGPLVSLFHTDHGCDACGVAAIEVDIDRKKAEGIIALLRLAFGIE